MLAKLKAHVLLLLAKIALFFKGLAVKFSLDVEAVKAEVAKLEAELKADVKVEVASLEPRLIALEAEFAIFKAKFDPPKVD